MTIEAPMTASSGPTKAETMSSGTARPRAESRVTMKTPLRAFSEPPTMATMMNGQRMLSGRSCKGAGRDTDGTIRRRNGVSNQADQDSLDGVETQGNQHRCRDSDSRTEAGHTFHEGAETPADKQGQDAAVLADRRQHVLDDIHALGVQGQIIRKDSGDDDQ